MNPYQLKSSEFIPFYDNLASMNNTKDISLVIAFPYSHQHINESIWDSFQHILNNNNKDNEQFLNIRIRIWHNKTASSLIAYEAIHTYCPKSSIIVASRFNIRFSSSFGDEISKSITEKYHYYTTSFTNENNEVIDFQSVSTYSDQIRMKALHFKSHFQYVQIFKADLLKMHFMHILKSAEIDFYETEASFVFPMLETIRLNIMKINKNLFQVLPR